MCGQIGESCMPHGLPDGETYPHPAHAESGNGSCARARAPPPGRPPTHAVLRPLAQASPGHAVPLPGNQFGNMPHCCPTACGGQSCREAPGNAPSHPTAPGGYAPGSPKLPSPQDQPQMGRGQGCRSHGGFPRTREMFEKGAPGLVCDTPGMGSTYAHRNA